MNVEPSFQAPRMTFAELCRWLEREPSRFLRTAQPSNERPQQAGLDHPTSTALILQAHALATLDDF